MKKIYSMIIIGLLILACPITTYADTGIYETADDLFFAYSVYDPNDPDFSLEERFDNSYPDSICGIWVTGDHDNYHYVIAVQDTNEGHEIRQKFLDLIEDDSTISFVYQKYSYNYLRQVQDELNQYFVRLSIAATYPDVYKNSVRVEILTEKKEDEKAQKILDELSQKYQDAIYFVYVDDYEQLVTLYDPATGGTLSLTNFMPSFFLFVAAMILFMFSFFIKLKERHLLVLQTTHKRTITVANQLTTKEIEEMVKKSNVAMPQDLDNRIMDTINKND